MGGIDRGSRSRSRVGNPAEEKRCQRAGVVDGVEERPLDDELLRLGLRSRRRAGRHADDGGGGCLGAVFVDRDPGLVDHRADLQRLRSVGHARQRFRVDTACSNACSTKSVVIDADTDSPGSGAYASVTNAKYTHPDQVLT